jgi:hypothetical protein
MAALRGKWVNCPMPEDEIIKLAKRRAYYQLPDDAEKKASIKIQKCFRSWMENLKLPPDIRTSSRYKISQGQKATPTENQIRNAVLVEVRVPNSDYVMRCLCVRDIDNPYVYSLWPLSKIPRKREVEDFFSKRKWTQLKNMANGLGMGKRGNVFSKSMFNIFLDWKSIAKRSKSERRIKKREDRRQRIELIKQKRVEADRAIAKEFAVKYYHPGKLNENFQKLLISGKSIPEAMCLAKEMTEFLSDEIIKKTN